MNKVGSQEVRVNKNRQLMWIYERVITMEAYGKQFDKTSIIIRKKALKRRDYVPILKCRHSFLFM